jgi:ribosomal protein S18 acetylase RimI-like enzyme
MLASPIFRPARITDAASLAVLVDIAGEGMPASMWSTMTAPGQSLFELGRERARRDTGGFSYRNAVVAEIGEVVACLVGYRLDDPYDLSGLDEMPELVRPLVLLEAKAPGSWYINVLAAFPEVQRQGLGRQLLDIAERKGREMGAPAVSVIVGTWNEGAGRLYARAGFAPLANEPAILPPGFAHKDDWVLMVKPLGAPLRP